MKPIIISALLLLSACDGRKPPPGEPQAGSINCTLNADHCEPGMKR